MRPGQQKQRSRGRSSNSSSGGGSNNNNNNQRKGQNPLTRTYDSSGPDVKIRGTAQHIAEKYMTLARDAQSSGDRVMAENYLQHAEHYNRIIAAAQAMYQERFQHNERQDFSERDEDENETTMPETRVEAEAPAPQPAVVERQPAPVVIDEQTPQPVFDGTPAEVQIEQEANAQENAEPSSSRRRSSSRSRRPPRQPKSEGGASEANADAAPSPVDEPAE